MSYRQKVFLKEFNKDEFAKFHTTYELINPDRPIETANVNFKGTALWAFCVYLTGFRFAKEKGGKGGGLHAEDQRDHSLF